MSWLGAFDGGTAAARAVRHGVGCLACVPPRRATGLLRLPAITLPKASSPGWLGTLAQPAPRAARRRLSRSLAAQGLAMAPALAAIDALLPLASGKAPPLANGCIAALAALSRVAGWRLAPEDGSTQQVQHRGSGAKISACRPGKCRRTTLSGRARVRSGRP
jgi:hypothetical protein